MSSNAVALTSVIATASVAIFGLVVQVWQSNRAARRAEKRARYDEIVKVYDTAGADMGLQLAGLRAVVTVFRVRGREYSPEAWNEAIDDQVAKYKIDPNPFTQEALLLYGAPQPVMDALAAAERAYDKIVDSAQHGRMAELDNSAFEPVEVAIADFYRAAGEHARSLLH